MVVLKARKRSGTHKSTKKDAVKSLFGYTKRVLYQVGGEIVISTEDEIIGTTSSATITAKLLNNIFSVKYHSKNVSASFDVDIADSLFEGNIGPLVISRDNFCFYSNVIG